MEGCSWVYLVEGHEFLSSRRIQRTRTAIFLWPCACTRLTLFNFCLLTYAFTPVDDDCLHPFSATRMQIFRCWILSIPSAGCYAMPLFCSLLLVRYNTSTYAIATVPEVVHPGPASWASSPQFFTCFNSRSHPNTRHEVWFLVRSFLYWRTCWSSRYCGGSGPCSVISECRLVYLAFVQGVLYGNMMN